MCLLFSKVKGYLKSVSFWFILAVLTYVLASVVFYKYLGNFDEKDVYNQTSLLLRAFIMSSVFYFLVVYLPAKSKREVLKKNFRDMYKDIKKEIIYDILWFSRRGGRSDITVTPELVDELFDVEKFRDLFKGGREGDEGWYAFCNHIQNNPEDFASLILKFKLLAKQIDFILHNYDIRDQGRFNFFKRLEKVLFDFEHMNRVDDYRYDEVKIFSRFVWEICAGWSFVDGFRGYDIIERFINEI